MRIAVMAVAIATAGSAATAQSWTPAIEARLTREFRACNAGGDARAGVHPAMMDCSTAELTRQDERLNRTYRAAMARLSPDRAARLRTAQRTWIRDRDRRCQTAYDAAGGGQASQLEQIGCLTRDTIARTIWLERRR